MSGFSIDDSKIGLRIFVVFEYKKSPLQLFENEETIRKLVAEELYHGFIFPRINIHAELTI